MESTWLWTSHLLGVAVYNWNCSTQRPRQEDCQVQSQPGLHSEPLLLCTWTSTSSNWSNWCRPTYLPRMEPPRVCDRRKCKTSQLFLPPVRETHPSMSMALVFSGVGPTQEVPKCLRQSSRTIEMSSVAPLCKPSSIQIPVPLLGQRIKQGQLLENSTAAVSSHLYGIIYTRSSF